jgi:hypothetical protein
MLSLIAVELAPLKLNHACEVERILLIFVRYFVRTNAAKELKVTTHGLQH